ncbi:MAG: hypothetical protein KKH11_03530, partial [Candidatus Omnitrophica bacterium]|nr:hypothetical protein [Candidatus Omnitrophota bacterium]
RPILAYNTNFFATFDKEVLKYSSLSEALEDVFEQRDNVKFVLRTAQEYVKNNSSIEVAKKFIQLFESLLNPNRNIGLLKSEEIKIITG